MDENVASRALLCFVVLCLTLSCDEEKQVVQIVGERPATAPKPSASPPARSGDDGLVGDVLERGPSGAPTGTEGREAAAGLYVAFSTAPETFVERARALPADRRGEAARFLLCAAGEMLRGGQEGSRETMPDLPPEVGDLLRLTGFTAGRSAFLRQLAGELLLVGRSVESFDRGDVDRVNKVVASQQRSLKTLVAAQGEDRTRTWREAVGRMAGALFGRIAPGC